MLCYRDRRYCQFTDCKAKCDQKITPQVERAAEKTNLGIAYGLNRPECYVWPCPKCDKEMTQRADELKCSCGAEYIRRTI